MFALASPWQAADTALRHHPLAVADGAEAAALEADLAAAAPVELGGPAILALLAGAFLAGGVLGAFRNGERFHFGQFVGECGYRWFANLRVVAIGAVLALGLGFALDAVEHRLLDRIAAGFDPDGVVFDLGVHRFRHRDWVVVHQLAGTVGFLILVGLAKLAMAHLARAGRHGAAAAWLAAVGTALRRPLTCATVATALLAVWVGAGAAAGAAARWLDAHERPWLAFAATQLGVVVGVWTLIVSLLAARAIDADRSAARG